MIKHCTLRWSWCGSEKPLETELRVQACRMDFTVLDPWFTTLDPAVMAWSGTSLLPD